MAFVVFFAAAAFEIGGCYLVWQAARGGNALLWLPALIALGIFAYLLTLTGQDSAGRAFAIYGGIYILASIAFMAGFEGITPDRWDMIGAGLAIAGAAIVFFGPRAV